VLSVAALVGHATAELGRKSLRDIQVETAYTWAARAVAAARLGNMLDAHEYWHEALEHAALAGLTVLQALSSEVGNLVPISALESR
jgi:hypothetical protein